MNGLFIHGLPADTVQREAVALLKGNGRPSRVRLPSNSNPWLQRIVSSGASVLADLKTTQQGSRRDLENPEIEPDGPKQTFEFPGRLKGETKRQGLVRCHQSCSGLTLFHGIFPFFSRKANVTAPVGGS